MTENEKLVRDETEAIECLKSNKPTSGYLMLQESIDMAIKALEEIQKYRKIEKDLKENYHANVDIPLLMKHFIETVFKGEKHEGFCILTNEDKEAWEAYRSIGTPEECRAAVEKQTAISRELIEGKYFCPKCHNLMPYPGYCGCGQKVY